MKSDHGDEFLQINVLSVAVRVLHPEEGPAFVSPSLHHHPLEVDAVEALRDFRAQVVRVLRRGGSTGGKVFGRVIVVLVSPLEVHVYYLATSRLDEQDVPDERPAVKLPNLDGNVRNLCR